MPKRDAYIEMRLKIEAVFKHYSEQSELYKRGKRRAASRYAGRLLSLEHGITGQDYRPVRNHALELEALSDGCSSCDFKRERTQTRSNNWSI